LDCFLDVILNVVALAKRIDVCNIPMARVRGLCVCLVQVEFGKGLDVSGRIPTLNSGVEDMNLPVFKCILPLVNSEPNGSLRFSKFKVLFFFF
jgi:hypothetical protein